MADRLLPTPTAQLFCPSNAVHGQNTLQDQASSGPLRVHLAS